MCPCGGVLTEYNLTNNRYVKKCKSCGRREVFECPSNVNNPRQSI